MTTNTVAATWLREDANGEVTRLLCLSDACLSEQEKEALDDLFNRAYEGADLFYIGTFDAWFSFSEAGAERTVISLLRALDRTVLGEFAVNREWSRAALAAGYVILVDPPSDGQEPETLPAIQGISVACAAAGEIPQ